MKEEKDAASAEKKIAAWGGQPDENSAAALYAKTAAPEETPSARGEQPGKNSAAALCAKTAAWAAEYPRPQLRRNSFFSLDGVWQLNGQEIAVPFPPEAALSGFQGQAGETLHYEKKFVLPAGFAAPGEQVLAHFGAADQTAEVFCNGRPAARHEGGYLPFSADITALLAPGENVLTVLVTDMLSHEYPYGKQRKKRGGMWYTPISGLWQSVWLEAVPPRAVTALRLTPDLTGVTLEIETDAPEYTVTIPLESGTYRETFTQKTARVDLAAQGETPHLWTPEAPYLYPLTIETATDRVESYFALRTVGIRAVNGRPRLCLNGEPVFLHGVLDQGYFADGIFLPQTPAGYEDDIRRMQALGFNMLRKHIKLEPETFYAACDRCGMLVLQDMVNSGGYNWFFDTFLPNVGFTRRPDRWPGGRARKALFAAHCAETQKRLFNHPCVVGYTIFNEGWGQFDADRMYRACKAGDPTRFYDATSGWFAQKESDVESIHCYFRNRAFAAKTRPLLLSECGGYARGVAGHLYGKNARFGYGGADTQAALTDKIEALYHEMVLPSIENGLCGCVYTQLSDVEDEVNGLYTYDRAVCKVDAARMRALAQRLAARWAAANGKAEQPREKLPG